MCSREQETSCKCFILGGCHFANKGWMVYILTVLSGSVYPAGYSLSAHWMHSPLFIHSFPCGQVLSLWWIGAGAGQLFSLDGTSLTCSELKRPPCQSSFATSVLFRSPHKGCHRLHTYADTSPHYLTSLGCFLFEFSSFQFHLLRSHRFMSRGDYGPSRSSFSCEDVILLKWWGFLGTFANQPPPPPFKLDSSSLW